MKFDFFVNGSRTGVVNAFLSVFLILCLGACAANRSEVAAASGVQNGNNEKWSVHYVPMQEDHKTVYGGLVYFGNEENRKTESPFAPWNITATEICFAYGAEGKEDKKICQRLERYNREGAYHRLSMRQEADRTHKEAFFSILVPRARSLRLDSVTLYGKEYAYVVTFTSQHAVEMPKSDFVNFGFLGVDASPLAGKDEPEISFVGTIMLPFKPELKVTGANCAVVSYDIPHVVKRVPLQKPTEKTFP